MRFKIYSVDHTEIGTIQKVLGSLTFLKQEYPDFLNWYVTKVQPGMKDGTRKVFVVAPASDLNEIAAVMILKNTEEEKKISTLCVMKKYRSRGLGRRLINLAISVLKDERPLITVSALHIEEFMPILEDFGFDCYETYADYYKRGITEYSYNGYLEERAVSDRKVG